MFRLIKLGLLCLTSIAVVSCGNKTSPFSNSYPSASPQGKQENRETAALPDRIECQQASLDQTLVLVVRDSKLPEGISAVALKNNGVVVLKFAAQIYSHYGSELLVLQEIPATENSKKVLLNLATKTASTKGMLETTVEDATIFNCSW